MTVKNNTGFLIILSYTDRKGGGEKLAVGPHRDTEISEPIVISIDRIYKEVTFANQKEEE